MPAYVVLYKWTQQGLASVKGSPERMRQARAAGEKAGVRTIGVWVTMGEYDLVGIYEAADDQTAAAALLALAGQGNATSVTMRAFSEDEFAQIVGKLP